MAEHGQWRWVGKENDLIGPDNEVILSASRVGGLHVVVTAPEYKALIAEAPDLLDAAEALFVALDSGECVQAARDRLYLHLDNLGRG